MITIIFKPLESCNSNCIYCAVKKKNEKEIMNYDLLETLFIRINEFLHERPDEMVNLTWHGGEVCLLGAEYFDKAFEFQDKYCSATKSRIQHSVQSNLTIINQPILDSLKRLGINKIGTSYEVIPGIRGIGEKRDSVAYNKMFYKGINLLEKNNFSYGFIYVVNKKSLEKPEEIFYHLTNLHPQSAPSFSKIYLYGDQREHLKDLFITHEEYADFLGAVFPIWWKNMDMYYGVTPFRNFYESVKKNMNCMKCEMGGSCTYRWMAIDPYGETFHCGRTMDFMVNHYGNLKERTIKEILEDKKRDEIYNRYEVLPETECKDCRFWEICRGGCPLDAYMEYGDFLRKTPNCEWIKIFIEKYFEPITNMEVNFWRRKSESASY